MLRKCWLVIVCFWSQWPAMTSHITITKIPSRIHNHVWPCIVIPTTWAIPGWYLDINDGIDLSKVVHVWELRHACGYIRVVVYMPYTECMVIYQGSMMYQIHFIYGHLMRDIQILSCKLVPSTQWNSVVNHKYITYSELQIQDIWANRMKANTLNRDKCSSKNM